MLFADDLPVGQIDPEADQHGPDADDGKDDPQTETLSEIAGKDRGNDEAGVHEQHADGNPLGDQVRGENIRRQGQDDGKTDAHERPVEESAENEGGMAVGPPEKEQGHPHAGQDQADGPGPVQVVHPSIGEDP